MRRIVLGFLQVSVVLAGASVMQAQALKSAPLPLEKTQWALTWVDGVRVGSTSPRQAFIELDPANHRLTGSGGCNQLTGGYELEGDHLRLTGTERTMMACKDDMGVEGKLVKALEEVREWKVSGQTLELLDGSGSVVARFSKRGTE